MSIKIGEVTEKVLRDVPAARDCDAVLIAEVYKRQEVPIYLDVEKLKAGPSFESITRARRAVQSKGLLVASLVVEEERHQMAEYYRVHGGVLA